VGKFTSAPTPVAEIARPVPKCQRCGWDFNERHEQTFKKADGTTAFRINTRDQIWIGSVIRCGACYEEELIRAGRHRYSDHEDIKHMQLRSIEQDKANEQERLNPTRRAA
jgi:uncharacterized protein (DUF983 family)